MYRYMKRSSRYVEESKLETDMYHKPLCAVKEETETVCLSASECTENSGKPGVGPVAVVGLGVGWGW